MPYAALENEIERLDEMQRNAVSRALELLRFARPNDQLALRTGRIIAAKLRFARSYQIESEA